MKGKELYLQKLTVKTILSGEILTICSLVGNKTGMSITTTFCNTGIYSDCKTVCILVVNKNKMNKLVVDRRVFN